MTEEKIEQKRLLLNIFIFFNINYLYYCKSDPEFHKTLHKEMLREKKLYFRSFVQIKVPLKYLNNSIRLIDQHQSNPEKQITNKNMRPLY